MAIEVATAADLDNVRNDLTADYVQTDDIDLSGWGSWNPISGNFSGSYDGQEYKIKNMTLSGASEQGLFGELLYDTTEQVILKNIIFENTTWELPGTSEYHWGIGALAGYIRFYEKGKLTIENCHSNNFEVVGDVSYLLEETFEVTGGLIGTLQPDYGSEIYIKNCSITDAKLKGRRLVGGLIGLLDSFGDEDYIEIQESHTNNIQIIDSGITTSDSYWAEGLSPFIGAVGLSGENSTFKTKNCYGKGSVSAHTDESLIADDSWAMIAGFVSFITYYYESDSFIFENCYSVCEYKNIFEKYWYYNEDVNYTHRAYGFIPSKKAWEGWNGGMDYFPTVSITNSYFDQEVGGEQSGDFNDKPRTTDEMTEPYASNTYETWDFDNIWGISSDYNDGYPVLRWGDYTFGNPYLLYFLEPPQTKIQSPSANSVTVKSPTAEYTAEPFNLSADKKVERVVEIDEGDVNVCRIVAEKLLNRWNRELKSVEGVIPINQDLDFEQMIRVEIDESMTDEDMPIQELQHDVINQTTQIKAGDIILNDNELLARILENIN